MSAPPDASGLGALLDYSPPLFPDADSPPSLGPRISQGTFQGGQDAGRSLGEFTLLSCLTSLPLLWSSHPCASGGSLLGIVLPDLGRSLQGTQAPGLSESRFLCSKTGMMTLKRSMVVRVPLSIMTYVKHQHKPGVAAVVRHLIRQVSCAVPRPPGRPSQGGVVTPVRQRRSPGKSIPRFVSLLFPMLWGVQLRGASAASSRVAVMAVSPSPPRSRCGFLDNAVTTWYQETAAAHESRDHISYL